MLSHLRSVAFADESFAAVLIFSLTGLDGSLWLLSKPFFAALAEVLALAM